MPERVRTAFHLQINLSDTPKCRLFPKDVAMTEIHFIVEEAPEGGYIARAVGLDIITEADDLPSLHSQVRDAVHCHFDDQDRPGIIRLHITREEVLAA
jgi:hypothetical protein